MFINLPVKDLEKSKEFFGKLGYTFNPQFTDENATCMIISESIYSMLLVEKFFQTFTPKKIADAKTTAEVCICTQLQLTRGGRRDRQQGARRRWQEIQ